jgi:hypothetical protein
MLLMMPASSTCGTSTVWCHSRCPLWGHMTRLLQAGVGEPDLPVPRTRPRLCQLRFFLPMIKAGIFWPFSDEPINTPSLRSLVSSFFALITHAMDTFLTDGAKE